VPTSFSKAVAFASAIFLSSSISSKRFFFSASKFFIFPILPLRLAISCFSLAANTFGNLLSGFRLERLMAITEMMIAAAIRTAARTRYNGVGDGGDTVGVGDGEDPVGVGDSGDIVGVGDDGAAVGLGDDGDTVGVGDGEDPIGVGDGGDDVGVVEVIAKVALIV
jgi:hypothetical protein